MNDNSLFIHRQDQIARARQNLIDKLESFPGKRTNIIVIDPERQRRREQFNRNVSRWLTWSVRYHRYTGKHPCVPAWIVEALTGNRYIVTGRGAYTL